MAVIFESILYDIILISFVYLLIRLHLSIKSKRNYWKSRSIPNIESKSILLDIIGLLVGRKNMHENHREMYDRLKGNKYGGFIDFGVPTLMILDPDLVERILTKDFHYFYNRGFPQNPERDPLNQHLFNLEGEKWRYIRYKLTPTFTSSKLKGMFEQISKCSVKTIKCLQEELKMNVDVSARSILRGYARDVIGSCAFGISIEQDNSRKEFHQMASDLITPNAKQIIFYLLWMYFPTLAKLSGITPTSQELEDYVFNLVSGTLKYRKENGIVREDFLQLMYNLQQDKEVEDREEHVEDEVIDQMRFVGGEKPLEKQTVFTDMCISAQSFFFLLAGSESISGTLNFALFSLAQTPLAQKKLHHEIDTVLAHFEHKWSYQCIKEMTYLDQVLQETMRIYPISRELHRICTEPYKLPDSNIVLEKGTRILIPAIKIQNDPDNYPSPEVFDPERFAQNNHKPNSIYMPFGNGPRVCIAMRFSVLELKVCLARIMHEFSIKLSEKTQLPVEYDDAAFTLNPVGEFWYQFSKRK